MLSKRLVVGVCLILGFADGARRHRQMTAGLDTTLQKCQCTQTCRASVVDGLSCDACDTSNCGKWKPFGRWDFCDFSPVQNFESQSAAAKISYYQDKLAANPRTTVAYKSLPSVLTSTWKTSVHSTFDNYLPEMPAGREKNIHTVGAVCDIEFNVGSSVYTGLFGRGSHQGFIRMGTAVEPDDRGITPGVGFKFPRSGVPSGDFVAMHNTDPGQSWNFFGSNISNHISPTVGKLKLLSKKFEDATICSTQVGLSNLAMYDQAGNAFTTPKFPFKLFLVPTVSTRLSPTTVSGYIEQFEQLSVGPTLFDVWACGKPIRDREAEAAGSVERNCGSPSFLGSMKTTSQCSASDYGDRHFHIRHQLIEEDWQLEPSFLEGSGAQFACGRSNWDWAGMVLPSSVQEHIPC